MTVASHMLVFVDQLSRWHAKKPVHLVAEPGLNAPASGAGAVDIRAIRMKSESDFPRTNTRLRVLYRFGTDPGQQ